MFERLPERFDPFEYVDKKRRIRGLLPLAVMDRVGDALSSRQGKVRIELEFMREGRWAVLSGRVEADLVLRCQCCLENLDWPVRSEVHLGVVRSIDEANLLPEELEPLLVEAGCRVVLLDLVQDELLLAVPVIPQHRDCKAPGSAMPSHSELHPFAVLAQLKNNQ